jgi:hypothetical protein
VNRPGRATYIRDLLTFTLGLLIILKQAGIGFDPPPTGPSIELLAIGALCCNVPGIIQVIAWRSGTSSSQSAQQSPPSPPLSVPSSGGDQ